MRLIISGMFLLIIILTLALAQARENQSEIEYYKQLITQAYQNGETYQFPRNAYKYKSSSSIKKFGTYDFVVIGSGSAGSVAASRLSEVRNWNVLVLEAGHWGNNLTDIPNMYTPIVFTDYNWAYNSTRQKTACLGLENDVCLYPRGKGVGGSSLINGLVYARGYKYDFDTWAKIAGHKRWNFDSVLQFYKKSENYVHNDPDAPYDPAYHGTGGYFQVEYHKPRSPLLNKFLDANKDLGYQIVDYNANRLGASIAQQNTKNGKRWDTGKAFLRPVEKRSNLKILTGSFVTKILINEKKSVTGVQFTRNGKNYYVKIRKEVVLSAGAIDSPKLLMLSGIGPKKHLDALGIPVIQNLAVGDNMRDNAFYSTLSFTSNYTEPDTSLEEAVEDYLEGKGSLTAANNNQGVGFYESSLTRGTGIPEIELEFVPAKAVSNLTQRYMSLTDQTYNDLWKNANPSQLFVIYVIGAHARSFGNLRLRSRSPFDYPLIDGNFLSDPGDIDINTLYEGIQLSLKLIQTKSFKSIDAKLIGGPLKACKKYDYLSKGYWYCALRQITSNLFHPSSTCSMGTDPEKGAVVNWELKVFGIQGLRVADISIMPISIAGHTNAPAVMIGDQVADLIKTSYENEI